jgi:hypothetical protein
MAYERLALRPGAHRNSQALYLIARSSTWHFDAFMFRRPDRTRFVVIETRVGGRKLIGSLRFDIVRSRHGGLTLGLSSYARTRFDEAINIQDEPDYDALNTLHWRYLYAYSVRKPPRYAARSACFHYLLRYPLLDPLAGLQNHYVQNVRRK